MIAEYLGIEFVDEQLALIMVGALFVLLLFGYPVAFTLGGVALLFGFFALDISYISLLPQRIWGVMDNPTLLAVPLFIFMGVMLERSGIAERLLETMSMFFGRMRGGMAVSVVLSGAVLAASTGIVGASVVTMGLISLPIMLKRGYSPSFSSGLICASGTLGQIIPPSIVLILLGDIVGVSVGQLFIAAVGPGLLLVALYTLYTIVFCRFSRMDIDEHEPLALGPLLVSAATALLPPGLLIVLVLGSIFFGFASPTEASAVGAFGAMLLAVVYRRLSMGVLSEVMERTVLLTCMVFMILIGAQAFGLVFRGLSGDDAIRDLVLSFEYSEGHFLAAVMVLLFLLGCFLDFIEIVFIVVPILVPLLEEYQFNLLWFAVLIAVNLQMSFITPPFGFSLFYLKGVAPPEVRSGAIYRGIIPFVVIQAVVVAAVVWFPGLATWLPAYLEGSG